MKGTRRTNSFANPAGALDHFDYAAPAELFMTRGKGVMSTMAYQRFATAAEAIRFVTEELPAPVGVGAILEVTENRFDHRDIQELYERSAYPLSRR